MRLTIFGSGYVGLVTAACFADRDVVGVHAVDLVWGLGTLHCLTQQEPLARDATRS